MHTLLLVFEFLGTTELLVIAVVALILFGPRKLPEIGRTVGKGIAEFKRASDDFKRTWEFEVELERRKPALDAAGDAPEADAAEGGETAAAAGEEVPPPPAAGMTAEDFVGRDEQSDAAAPTVARGSSEEEAGGGDPGVPPAGDAWHDAAADAEENSTPRPSAEKDRTGDS